jgi:hypothetical protein
VDVGDESRIGAREVFVCRQPGLKVAELVRGRRTALDSNVMPPTTKFRSA